LGVLDFILNVVCLLLWLSWRSVHLDPLANSTPATLAGTLKKTERTRFKGWQFLVGLIVLLALRAVAYWQLGSPVNWTPKLDLGFVVLSFRSETLKTVTLYSLLSFLRFVLIFYFWLMVLSAANRATVEPDPISRLIRLHLGSVAGWAAAAQLIAPCLLGASLWLLLHGLLVQSGVIARLNSSTHLAGQALMVGASLWLSLKWLVPPILLLHVVNSYVYLGGNPLWEFVATTSQSLLQPLHRVPLRVRRIDLTPVAAIILVVLLLHWLPHYATWQMARRNLTIWPQ
jgi:uncharacterized protein YggT (Ycf19 family)